MGTPFDHRPSPNHERAERRTRAARMAAAPTARCASRSEFVRPAHFDLKRVGRFLHVECYGVEAVRFLRQYHAAVTKCWPDEADAHRPYRLFHVGYLLDGGCPARFEAGDPDTGVLTAGELARLEALAAHLLAYQAALQALDPDPEAKHAKD